MTAASRPGRPGFHAIPGKLAPYTPTNCVCCDVPMRTKLAPRDGALEHAANGLCSRCHSRQRYHRHYAPVPHPGRDRVSTRWRSLTLLAEYEHLKSCHPQMTKRQIADRLGLKLTTLDRAICRGRAKRREQEAADRLAAQIVEAEVEAHRINDDMIAYATRKAS